MESTHKKAIIDIFALLLSTVTGFFGGCLSGEIVQNGVARYELIFQRKSSLFLLLSIIVEVILVIASFKLHKKIQAEALEEAKSVLMQTLSQRSSNDIMTARDNETALRIYKSTMEAIKK